ncbi:MAG: hypothetical protein IJA47_02935 [Oscillospiraceae bacterium]|nr:hypothetical protein [Oscillospiraceae bacterium]
MTKRKSTKRALLLSALSLLMCVSMLIGSTFAWFTDSVTSGSNKIQAGNLAVDLELYNKETDQWNSIKENNDPIFTYQNWEPGYVDAKLLKVENEGSLALKWKAAFVSDTALGILADVIDVFVKPGATEAEFEALTRDDLATWTNAGTVRQFLGGIEASTYGTLTPKGTAGATANLGIALKMRETAGNEYQEQTIGFFDIKILATQYTYEEDSFDEFYDKLADYDGEISNAASMQAAFNQGGNFKVTEDFIIPNDTTPIIPEGKTVALDLNGKSITAEDAANDYAIRNLGELTLYDSKAATTYSLRSTSAGSINARGIYNGYNPDGEHVATAKITVLNGVYNALGTNGGAAIFNYGIVDIKSGTFTSVGGYSLNNQAGGTMTIETAIVTGGIYNVGTLTIEDGEIATNRGGFTHAIYHAGPNLIVNGGNFSGNGNEVINSNSSPATINGGTFTKVEKTSYLMAGSQMVINGGVFNAHESNPAGHPVRPDVTVKGGTFNYKHTNVATGYQAMDMGNGTYVVMPDGYEKVADGVLTDAAGNYLIYNANGFVWVEAQADSYFANKTLKLMNDIDCADVAIKPIRFWEPEMKTTFDGQGYTISNLDISSNSGSDNQALFNGTVDIKNVTIDGARIQGNGRVGALGGTIYGTITNCHVKNSMIFSSYWQAGGLVGLHNSGNVIDCSAENTEVYAPSAAGAIIGLTNENGNRTFENCSVKDCVVDFNGSFGGVYDNLMGAITGGLNVDGTTYTFNGCSIEGTTIKGVASNVATDFSMTTSNVYVDGVQIQ